MKTPNSKRLLLQSLSYIVLISSIFLVSCTSDSDVFDEFIADGVAEETPSDDETSNDGTNDSDDDDNENPDDESSEEESDSAETGDENDDMNDSDEDNNENSDEESSSCSNPEDFIFVEEDGIVVVEFESAAFSGDWEQRANEPNFSGQGFMVWTGSQNLQNPGTGLTTFSIEIETPGTYQFIWNSAVTIGNQGSEYNDTWLRFNDADDFFGQRGNSVVYPADIGKTPNPNGSTRDGWFKIYRSGNDLGFKWQSKTSDNDPHDIFVTFNSPGIYIMEISARSSGHAIDKFVLFTEDYSVTQATEEIELSEIDCN